MASELDYPKCTLCNGWGVGLVVNPEKICAHCARKTCAFFDPEHSKWCMKGFVDISPKADGGILKKIIHDGEPGTRVVEGCPTFVQYVGRLEDGTIFDTTRDIIDGKHVGGTDDEFEFLLGREKVIKGWDIGVATMYQGELSEFIIRPEYAYGKHGFAPKVEPDATLHFEIELIKFKAPLPRFPSKQELAESKRRREAEEREMMEKNPPPTIDERISSSTEKRLEGNGLIAKGKYEEARKSYDSGFIHIFFSQDEWNGLLTEAERQKINAVKLPLHLNRALAKIKLENYEDALWDCDKSIELDSSNVKAYYRRALVYLSKLEGEFEKEQQKKFWDIDKGYKFYNEAENSLKNCKKYSTDEDTKLASAWKRLNRDKILLEKFESKYKRQQKNLYKNTIFSKLEAENKKLQDKEIEEKKDNDDYDDMPPLE